MKNKYNKARIVAVVIGISICIGIIEVCSYIVKKDRVSNQIKYYYDKDTCVEYLIDYRGGIAPRYNQDGMIRLNETCLEEQ